MTFDEWKEQAIFTQELRTQEEWMRIAFDAATYIKRKACAIPPEMSDYLLSHLQQQRRALDGFLALGNEKPRAKRLDGWIASMQRYISGCEYDVYRCKNCGHELPHHWSGCVEAREKE